jgi:hypothetical protein
MRQQHAYGGVFRADAKRPLRPLRPLLRPAAALAPDRAIVVLSRGAGLATATSRFLKSSIVLTPVCRCTPQSPAFLAGETDAIHRQRLEADALPA